MAHGMLRGAWRLTRTHFGADTKAARLLAVQVRPAGSFLGSGLASAKHTDLFSALGILFAALLGLGTRIGFNRYRAGSSRFKLLA